MVTIWSISELRERKWKGQRRESEEVLYTHLQDPIDAC